MPHPPVTLEFQSTLRASRTELWNWITDITCLRKEMMPFLRMTAPRGVARLTDVQVTLGKPLFRSWILYFGVLPLDYSKVTLLSFAFEQGFVEQSPMASMRVWRHTRQILPHPELSNTSILRDTLEFQPRFLHAFTVWFVRCFFTHRHSVLRRELGDA
jgi:hypothetical protein